MKRKMLVAALILGLALLLCSVALAVTDPIVCNMEVSPSSLAEPGEVTVTITVSNSGETDMVDPLTLYSPTSEVVSDFGDKGSVTLKAGEVKTWTGKWTVNQRTLDNGQIVYFVKYFLTDDNGTKEAQSQPIRGKLNATESKTDIEIKRTISPGTAREGQTVTVKYDIVNTGTVSIKNITLQENKDIKAKTVTVAEELKAGETAQVKLPVTMGKKDLTSSATITYTSGDSKDKQVQTVGEQKITYGEAAMTAKLTSSAKGVAINGTVTLSLELKNSGSVDYTDVRVSDNTLGEVFTNQELTAGATLKLDKEITLTATTDYQYHITAIDNTGTEVSLDTDSLTLTAVDPSNIVHLNVTMAADRTEVYTQPGIVRFTVTVENDSSIDAKEVGLYHGSTLIYTFASIPAGESRKLTRDAALSMAGTYQFSAVTVDALENSNRFESNEIQIAFSVPTPAPLTPTPPLVPTPEPTYAAITVPPISDPSIGTVPKFIRMFFYPLMVISIILLAGAGVLLVLASKKRLEQKKASDAALDHLERAKRRDYVAPSDEPTETEGTAEVKPATRTGEQTMAVRSKTELGKKAGTEEIELPHMKYVRNAYQRSAKDNTNAFGHSNLYDEDPLTKSEIEPSQGEEPYHTYGSEDDVYNSPAHNTQPTAKPIGKPKDWSAYAKRPEPQADPFAVYDDGYAQGYEQGYEAVQETQDGYSDTYGQYQAYDTTDPYVQPEMLEQDGYVNDAYGYEDPNGIVDGQAGYTDDYGHDAYTADSGSTVPDAYSAKENTAIPAEGMTNSRRSRRNAEERKQDH